MRMSELDGKFAFLHQDQRHMADQYKGFEVVVAESFKGSLDEWKLSRPWNEPQNTPQDHFINGFKAGYLAASK